MAEAKHLTMGDLEAGLDAIRKSPKDEGVIELIVRRPLRGLNARVTQSGVIRVGDLVKKL